MRGALLILSLCLAGCGPPPYAKVEVWNRTLDPIWLIDQDGKRFDVSACGYGAADRFRVSEYAVWSKAGRYFRSETGGPGPYRDERLIILSPSKHLSVSLGPLEAFPPMPPCEGHTTEEGAPEQP